MNRIAMSPAASGLLRALIARSGASRDRILLTDLQTIDWRSLTFTGERHQFQLRIPGPGSREVAGRMCSGLGDAEFSIAGVIVADIALLREPASGADGSTCLTIEALTVSED
jgi:hypothetical protein